MELSPTFRANIEDVYGEPGTSWLANLPQLVEELAEAWKFQLLAPVPELTYSFVARVAMVDREAVLKMSPPGGNLEKEMKWLTSFVRGVPTVYAFDPSRNALLMEQLRPGTSLTALIRQGRDEDATRAVCAVIGELQAWQKPAQGFRHLADLADSLDVLRGKVENRLLSMAETLFRDLTADRSGDRLLHGDLHHGNILLSEEGWKPIDPHGYVGDPAAEPAAMMRNPYDGFPKERALTWVLERRLDVIAEELPFDRHRVACWSFCLTMLSAAWSVEDHGRPGSWELTVAAALAKLV